MSASRSLTKSDKNYVTIKLFVSYKFDAFMYGKRVIVETDHKPLEIIAKKTFPRGLPKDVAATSEI